MAHWLDENIQSGKSRPASKTKEELIAHRKLGVQKNYEAHQNNFDGFIGGMESLIMRANNMPEERRRVFGLIEGRARSSKLNNYLHTYSSSRRLPPFKLFGLIPFTSNSHYKHVRVVFFSVSDKPGMADLELKESVVFRSPLGEKRSAIPGFRKKPQHYHAIHRLPAEKLNDELMLEFIDWLAFSVEIADCPAIIDNTVKLKIIKR